MNIIIYEDCHGEDKSCWADSEKAKELHTCPYKEDINGDYETLCDCDEERTHECAMDI